jgi:hypothetical protein
MMRELFPDDLRHQKHAYELISIYINYAHAFDGIQNIMLHDTSMLDRAGNIEVLEETKIPA